MKINLRSVVAGVAFTFILAGTVLWIKVHRPKPVVPVRPVSMEAFQKILGPANAPVKLVIYSDFQCPSCRLAQQELHKILAAYPGKIQLSFRHFPLTSHVWSAYAHQAAECMNRQGKFWLYHDRLYETQPDWAPLKTAPVEIFGRYAQELGADLTAFGACMADETVAHAIYAEKEEGNQRQVSATPTLFLGDERFVGPKEMTERGENAIRKVLDLPPNPAPEKKPEPLAPAPLKGAAQ